MRLLIFDDMTQCTDAEVRKLLPTVSSQRRDAALQYKFVMGQYSCLKSYSMLTEVLRNESDANPMSILVQHLAEWSGEFVFNEHGKPYLQSKNTGERIPDVDFNISHCKHGIAVAVDSQPVGLDIESFHDAEESLLNYTMNEQEVAQIKHADNPTAAFTALWTRKEAVLKLLGTGIVDNLFEVLCCDDYLIKTTVNEEKSYVFSIASFKSSNSNYCCPIKTENARKGFATL